MLNNVVKTLFIDFSVELNYLLALLTCFLLDLPQSKHRVFFLAVTILMPCLALTI